MSPSRRGGRGSSGILRGRQGELPAALEPPETHRGVTLSRVQWIGLPLMLVLPVLALAGIVGDRERQTEARGPDLALRVTYPERLNYSTAKRLEAAVTNVGSSPLAGVIVRLDADYLSGFSDLRILPEPARQTRARLDVELPVLPPGQTAEVRAEFQGERYGRHRGTVEAIAAGRSVHVEVSTLVLP